MQRNGIAWSRIDQQRNCDVEISYGKAMNAQELRRKGDDLQESCAEFHRSRLVNEEGDELSGEYPENDRTAGRKTKCHRNSKPDSFLHALKFACAVVICDQRKNALCKSQSGIKSDHIHFFGNTHAGNSRAAIICHKLVGEDVGNHGKGSLQGCR